MGSPNDDIWVGEREEEEAKLVLREAKREVIFRERRQKPHTPGPGANDLPTMFGGRIEDKFGVCKNRPSLTARVAPAFSLQGRQTDLAEPDVKVPVGPGCYTPREDSLKKKSRGCVFGTQDRILSAPAQAKKYMNDSEFIACADGNDDPRLPRSPRYGFGSIDRSKPASTVQKGMSQGRGCRLPGPGEHYPNHAVSSRLNSGPDYSFGQPRVEDKSKEKPLISPGPLTYRTAPGEAWTVPAAPRCSFGTSPRLMNLNEKSKRTPGPGQYGNVLSTRKGVASDSAAKWSMTERSQHHPLDGKTF